MKNQTVRHVTFGGETVQAPFFFFKVYLFLRESKQVGKGQREGDRIRSRLQVVSAKPKMGLELTNHEIMT